MPCYSPLKGWPVGVTENGKTAYKVTSYDVARIDVIYSSSSVHAPRYVYVTEDMIKAGYTRTPGATEQKCYFVELSCGQCEGCRLRYARAWADRCMLELQSHEYAWFVTLTYDDDHVPLTWDDLHMSLCKRDFQLFMKRLRKAVSPTKLRFFAAGEYGDQTMRPHYHAIIYGLDLQGDDLEFYKRDTANKYSIYKSPFLAKIWQNGFVVVGKVTWDTCAYTARYVMKKLKGPAAQAYSDLGIEPPFSLMSRKPGIARAYYEEHPELFDYDHIDVSTPTGGKEIQIPRYFDTLLEVDNPDLAESRKLHRQEMAKAAKEHLLAQTDLPYLEALEVKRQAKLGQLKKLRREL